MHIDLSILLLCFCFTVLGAVIFGTGIYMNSLLFENKVDKNKTFYSTMIEKKEKVDSKAEKQSKEEEEENINFYS